MGISKVEIDRFDGKTDFSIWKKRIKAVLVQMKVAKDLEGESKLPTTMSDDEKADILDQTYSTIILYLSDRVFQEVDISNNNGWSLDHIRAVVHDQQSVQLHSLQG